MFEALNVLNQFDEDDDTDEEVDDSWISWFCRLDGNEILAEVDEDYIRDRFNLFGIKQIVPNYDNALLKILQGFPTTEVRDSSSSDLMRDSRDLYGAIHARYIISPRGLTRMKEKYVEGVFGTCPRVLCEKQHCLPVGMSDDLEAYNVRLYCPKCQETYEMSRKKAASRVDGAYFGTAFPHVFLQSFPALNPLEEFAAFVPTAFGFRIKGKFSIIEYKMAMGEYGDSMISKASPQILQATRMERCKDVNAHAD